MINHKLKANLAKLEHQLKQEISVPNNPKLVKNLLKEKEIEIQILKKNLKIPEGHDVQTPELVSLQTKRDEFCRDMLKFKE